MHTHRTFLLSVFCFAFQTLEPIRPRTLNTEKIIGMALGIVKVCVFFISKLRLIKVGITFNAQKGHSCRKWCFLFEPL
jgi:hypothetical protein